MGVAQPLLGRVHRHVSGPVRDGRLDGPEILLMSEFQTHAYDVLIIGAGPIIIGQACEFDYSGTQACRALREENYRIILVNSNPATIMTDRNLADATYLEPVTPEAIASIIEKEKPDALLPTVGGQTALDTTISLNKNGVLEPDF